MDIEANNDLYPFLFKLIIKNTRKSVIINLLPLFPFNDSQNDPKSNYNRSKNRSVRTVRTQLNQRHPTK